MDSRAYAWSKRAADAPLAALLLLLVVPVALVGLAPVRRRLLPEFGETVCVGRGGGTFALRHEIVAEGRSAFTRRLARSPLRRWPALLAVLAGELSFVGPRPLDVNEARTLAPADRDRFAVTPGLV